jgi:hypothetical protein
MWATIEIRKHHPNPSKLSVKPKSYSHVGGANHCLSLEFSGPESPEEEERRRRRRRRSV